MREGKKKVKRMMEVVLKDEVKESKIQFYYSRNSITISANKISLRKS